jgi:hypothetical protein
VDRRRPAGCGGAGRRGGEGFPAEGEAGRGAGRGWTKGASTGFIKGLGVLEILAAAGLLLPRALGIAPVMLPVMVPAPMCTAPSRT